VGLSGGPNTSNLKKRHSIAPLKSGVRRLSFMPSWRGSAGSALSIQIRQPDQDRLRQSPIARIAASWAGCPAPWASSRSP